MADVRIVDKPSIAQADSNTELFVVTPIDGSPALRKAPIGAFKDDIDGFIDDKMDAFYGLPGVFAPEYSDAEGAAYAGGALVMHEGLLYRCNLTTGTTSGAFAPQAWDQVRLSELFAQAAQKEAQDHAAAVRMIEDLEVRALKLEMVDALPQSGEYGVVYALYTDDGYELWWWPDEIAAPEATDLWQRFGGNDDPASSTVVVQNLPQAGDANVDYILESGGTYRYYKWVSDAWKLIGADAYSRTETDTKIVAGDQAIATLVNESISQVNGKIDKIDGTIAELTTKVNNAQNFVEDITEDSTGVKVEYHDGTSKTVRTQDTSVKVVEVDELAGNAGVRVTYSDGTTKDLEIAGTGGGGGASGTASIAYVGSSDIQVVRGDSCVIQYILTAKDAAEDLVGNGTAVWYVGGARRATSVALNGQVSSFDVGSYLSVGTNSIRVTVTVDTGGDAPKVVSKTWTVTAINLYLTWDYADTTINTASAISLQWTPYGEGIAKTTHVIIDETERDDLATTTSRSGVTQYVSLAKLAHGSHRVEMYLTGTVNGVEITSPRVVHDMIFVDDSSQVPVIASSLNVFTVTQYDTLRIPIVVYDPAGMTTTITLWEDSAQKDSQVVDRNLFYWNYTPTTAGQHLLEIKCGTRTKPLTIRAEELDIDNEEISGYSFRMKASDIASNAALQAWESNGVRATFSSNFDWHNGGIKSETDENGGVRQYICVKAGTRMTIGHKLFADDATQSGKNFKIIFKIVNCRTYDAQIASSFAEGIGLRMYAHEATFESDGTQVSTQYGEDSYIELEFDVYPAPTETNGSYRYIMAWVDGVIGVSRVYGSSDNFTQTPGSQTDLVIGSDDCDVYVYLVKAYPTLISRANHIINFVADAPNAQEMLKRFNRNDILDGAGNIDYQKLMEKNPDCRVWLYDIPYMTNGKKDKVSGCTFQQLWKNGKQYDQLSGTCVMTVQGTSSVKYIRGAANTDENFTALEDGDGNDLLAGGVQDETYGNNWYVEDTENPGHAKIFVAQAGEELGPECIAVERDSNRNVTKYIKALGFKLSDDSCPITYSNTKVNFASCEQVNNMCNAIWYQRFNPYPSLTPRDCMEFAMGVQFIRETGTPPDDAHFKLWDGDDVDKNKYYMYSIANMGNSKKNVHVFHDLSNPSEVCIEINDNDLPQMMMVSDDLSLEDWSGDVYFGVRYPDTKNPSTEVRNAWQRLVTWMASRNPAAATNEPLSQSETYAPYTFRGHDREGTQVLRGTTVSQYAGTYTHDTFERRMARMLYECEDYMVMDSFVYHFIYIERHTMVDNVAKNTFWSSTDLLHWDLSKAYDMDTSDGNNNQGKMVFDYGSEWDSLQGNGQIVFNSAQSVWFVFVANLYEACRTMFTNREALGAWSASAYHAFFVSEQQKVPERVWSECYWYDYLRTQEQGISAEWITFLDGGQKTHQRHHYEYFEELYDSSKYRGTAATSQNVNFRAYTPATWAGVRPKAELTVTMYNKMYITVEIGTTAMEPIKAERGVPVVVNFEQYGNPNNMVIAINAAPMIQAIEGLEQLYPDTCVFSMATRLRRLSIGSDAAGYQNTFLKSLKLENNRMLEELYAQNLVSVNEGLDLTACQSLRYLDARGSSFTGYDFAAGGLLEEVYIETPVSLSLRNLYYLLEEKFHVASYAQLSTLRFEDTPGLDSLAILNAATGLTRLRLLGVNWILAETDVLNRILDIMGMSETGANVPQSVLSGDVYVSGNVRNHELSEFSAAWPSLTVRYEAGNLIEQFLITYVNADADHTVLYTTYVDRGTTPPDPFALGLISEPTLAATAQYTFKFGTWQDGEYVTGSGWDGLTGGATGPRTVSAKYVQTVRTYKVTWYIRPGLPFDAKDGVQYGAAVTCGKGIPTRTDGEEFYTWYLFKDWDKSTGYITGDTDVYAVWDVGTLPATGTPLSNMTPAQMLSVGQMDMQDSYWTEGDHVDITLGHDHDYSNVESIEIGKDVILTGVAAEQNLGIGYWLDGSHYHTTDIKLFTADAPAFTLALDFQMNAERSGETLISCQEGGVAEGFRIYYNGSNVALQWGNMTQVIGYNKQRDIVILRHPKGSNYLYVYTSYQNSSRFATGDSYYPLMRSNSTQSDEPLTFGAAHYPNNANNPYQSLANATIHWCKIWLADLGDAVAREMAIWPREVMRMEYWGKNKYYYAGASGLCKASFVSNSVIGGINGRGFWHQTTNDNTGGWETSLIREYLANRFIKALPNEWQKLLRDVEIKATAGQMSSEIISGADKITLLSLNEAGSMDANYTGEIGPAAQPRVPWLSTGANRVKFKGLFREYGSAVTVYACQAQPEILYQTDIQYGTLWQDQANSSNIFYVFVPRALMEEYGFVNAVEADTQYADGYWVRADYWWCRSPSLTYLTYFISVNITGNIGYYSAGNSYGLVPAFSF